MRAIVFTLLVTAGCDTRVAPPFVYRLTQAATSTTAETTLTELQFDNYEQALDAPPVTVTVSAESQTAVVTKAIGSCADIDCVGPVTAEELTLTLSPGFYGNVMRIRCDGLDGIWVSGIDSSGTGACDR